MTESNYLTGDLTSTVLRSLHERTGLYLPDKPVGQIPTLPTDITLLSDEDLMILFTDFTAWADYASSQLAVAAAEEKEFIRLHELHKARQVASSTSKSSVTATRAAAEADAAGEGYKASERYSYRKIIESISGNLERDAALVSRELSRRLGDKAPTRTRRMWGTP